MYFLQLCVLLVFPYKLQVECSRAVNKSVEAFVDMVLSNLTACANYILPINNENLTYVYPSEENESHVSEQAMWHEKEQTFYYSLNKNFICVDFGTFDFVIVGAGSAGTLLANRLTEIKEWNVLLLEAGGPENDFSDIPGMAPELCFTDMNWGYFSLPQKRACKAMDRDRCTCARGKVVGGSSTINAKMYVRGNRADYDTWEMLGNPGWSHKKVLPYFIKTENSEIDNGDPGYHGKGGLLDINYIEPTIFTSVFLKGKEELGDKVIDYNGKHQIGASRVQFTINGNRIASGGRAFIDPFLFRKNLNVTINAFVTRLIIDNKGKTALGVEFTKNGRKYTVKAKNEIILSAGAINTPQILMLSGLGPKKELNKIGIKALVDLPVGEVMEDHAMFIGLHFRTNQTLFNESIEILLKRYLNNHRPYTAPFNVDSTSFMNVNNKRSSVPDIQQVLNVPPFNTDGWRVLNLKKQFTEHFDANLYSDISIWLVLLHPKSKGSVTLKSKSPLDFPIVDYNYYAVEEDMETMIKAVKETLKLQETDAFKSIDAKYVNIFKICTNYTEGSDEYWKCMIEHLTSTLYHPAGTTRMGTSVRNSVVSSKLLVHGMKRLRVVDAGIIPKIPSGNTNAPTYMIAEKAADEIKIQWMNKIQSS